MKSVFSLLYSASMKQLFFLFLALTVQSVHAQHTHADSLRGGYAETRDWWDVTEYELDVTFDIAKKEISGSNTITYSVILPPVNDQKRLLQIDLQEPLVIDSISLGNSLIISATNRSLLQKDGNAYFLDMSAYRSMYNGSLTVYYHGKPREAVNPPWDGGVIWKKDQNGKSWVTVACQGLGASVWYPCKDSQADEISSARMHFTCPTELACISNGRFEGKEEQPNGLATYSWKVSNPINNYCIIPYIGDYVNIHEHFAGEKGMLELDYWVISGNEEKAKEHFTDVPRTMEALEYWFGPYPFYEDGYKLIEAPHLGMEHQSAIAYGNKYKMGYAGTDLSGTGEGLKWDFIIVHETGHEWFGNNITTKDIADMWVHEGFTDYSETLFTEYWFGKEAAQAYIVGLRKNIANDIPIIGDYQVNSEGSGDMYYKGGNMIHTIRQLIGNDSVFRGMLRGLNSTFYHQTVTTAQIENYMTDYTKIDLKPVFDQYLRTKNPPTLQLIYKKNKVKYRWIHVVKGFDMPMKLDGYGRISPTSKWKSFSYDVTNPYIERKTEDLIIPVIDPNFYILTETKLTKGFVKAVKTTKFALPVI